MENNMDFKTSQVPSFGWRVQLNHSFPEKWRQNFKPKFKQILQMIPLLFRYLWYSVSMWWKGRRPIMDFIVPLTSKQWSGVPLGGIGGGSMSRSFLGEFCRYQLTPGFYEYNVVQANQFILTVHSINGDLEYQQVLSPLKAPNGGKLGAWRWEFPKLQAKYTALYPRAWTEYYIPQHGLKLICRQVSPVIPHNYKDSCLPGAVFAWTIETHSSETKLVSITFTFKNGTGDRSDKKGSSSRTFEVEEDGVRVEGASISQQIVDMNCTYSISTVKKEGVFVSRTSFDPNGDGKALWDDLAITGQLTALNEQQPIGPEVACAVCARTELTRGKAKMLEFSLVWDMPKIHFQLNTRQYYRYYTKFFGNDGTAGPKMSLYALKNFNRWEQEINAWQQPVLDDLELPEWYKSALFNETYYVADGGTVWLLTEEADNLPPSDPRKEYGRFAYLEGHEYRMYNTYDVHFYASFTLSQLWPELQACLQYDFRDTVFRTEPEQRKYLMDGTFGCRKEINSIPHDLGDPGEEPFVLVNSYMIHNISDWKDLNLKFVLQCYRDYRLSGKLEQLQDMWPQIQAVMSKALTWDKDGDGMIENGGYPDQTYDVWVMSGVSAYCGSLWLASLCVVAKMATHLNCPEISQKYSALLDKAKSSFNGKLWNGEYYNFDSSQSPHSSSVMADQLCGLWYLHACDITDEIFPADNVRKALESIYRLNVKGVENGEMGAVNGMMPDGTIDDVALQSEEIWTGVTYGLASLMMFEGMIDAGFHTASGIYETVYNRIGLGFETPEALYPSKAYRSIGYMRPLSIWAMQLAWQRRLSTQA